MLYRIPKIRKHHFGALIGIFHGSNWKVKLQLNEEVMRKWIIFNARKHASNVGQYFFFFLVSVRFAWMWFCWVFFWESEITWIWHLVWHLPYAFFGRFQTWQVYNCLNKVTYYISVSSVFFSLTGRILNKIWYITIKNEIRAAERKTLGEWSNAYVKCSRIACSVMFHSYLIR